MRIEYAGIAAASRLQHWTAGRQERQQQSHGGARYHHAGGGASY